MKKDLAQLIETLTLDQQSRVYTHIKTFKEADDLLKLEEQLRVKETGLTSKNLPEHEWEAMLKRNELSNTKRK